MRWAFILSTCCLLAACGAPLPPGPTRCPPFSGPSSNPSSLEFIAVFLAGLAVGVLSACLTRRLFLKRALQQGQAGSAKPGREKLLLESAVCILDQLVLTWRQGGKVVCLADRRRQKRG